MAYRDLVDAIDALDEIDAQATSIDHFRELLMANSEKVAAAETVISRDANELEGIENMRRLHNSLVRFGIENRSERWSSVASATINRLWNGVHGWQP